MSTINEVLHKFAGFFYWFQLWQYVNLGKMSNISVDIIITVAKSTTIIPVFYKRMEQENVLKLIWV